MRYLSELIDEKRQVVRKELGLLLPYLHCGRYRKSHSVNLLALGDVGGTLLMGLRLLGGSEDGFDQEEIEQQRTENHRQTQQGPVSRIGIYDLNDKLLRRYEREINQICFPDRRRLPPVMILTEAELFDCDMFVFCASGGVPAVGAKGDVRMAQLEANRQLVSRYSRQAVKENFRGIFAVVSDPVDPLCKAAVDCGLNGEQVQGYGLGVMNGRASYFAAKEARFESYLQEGRAFGPHGEDLVIANSIRHYDEALSQELTELTLRSNLETREDGFKPYIAPALSSGAISLIETLKGGWNYSSVYLGRDGSGAFLGCRNRRTTEGIEIEDLPLDDRLFARIEKAYQKLAHM